LTKEDFQKIYKSYVRKIWNYIYYRSGSSNIADDISQETFIKVWEKQIEYQEKKILPLLYKISRELFIDYIRKNKVQTEYVEEIKFQLKDSIDSTYDKYNKEEMLMKCEIALVNLSEKERTVFLMSRKDELKYKEIAESLNISIKAVEKRMSNALKKIKL